jgi:ligand-binding sensor domain-containing protein/signal transduction histidine kinase/DNA-binding response OmpR family regulator
VKIQIFILTVCLFACSELSGQTGKFYSPDKDLSNSLINKVYQDKTGYIWIATENGLNKFEGTKFTVYKHIPNDSKSLKDNYVRTVFEDGKSNFWVGCVNGLMKYNQATDDFTEIKMIRDGKVVSPHVASIIETKAGDVYIATSGQGLFVSKNSGGEIYFESLLYDLLNNSYLNLVFEDSKGNLWIGSDNNGLNLYSFKNKSIKTFQAPDAISSNSISSIVEDGAGIIYVGTLNNGLDRYNENSGRFDKIPYHGNSPLLVKILFLTKDDRLFIGTDGQGLKLYDKTKGDIIDYEISTSPFDFSKGKVHSILQDKEENLWLGIFQKGVIFIPVATNKFEYYGLKSLKNNSIGSSAVMSIYKDRDEITWIGTDNEGIYGINGQDECVYHFSQTSSPTSVSNIILSIYEDSERNLWVGSFMKGIAKLNRKTGICEYIKELQNEKIYCITEDDKKNLFIGTYGSGFYKYSLKENKITEHFESGKRENDDFTIDELTNDWINDILIDKEGLLWIAHYKGVSCYNPATKTFINYLAQNTILPKVVAYTLFEDKNGILWIGTSEGLYQFDKKTENLKNFSSINGLPNDVICGITEDEEGNLWISAYYGICKFNVTENKFTNYYVDDGLQGNEFTRGAVYKDAGGKIFFGGIYGVTSFYPGDITEAKKELNVYITDFYTSGKPVKSGDKSGRYEIINNSVMDADQFTLSNNDNTFSIEFSTFQYSNQEKIKYQYRMEELEYEWINTYSGINRVTYNNLKQGTYNFMVRAIDNENISPVRKIRITVMPPWYGSTLAYIAYILLVLTFLYLAANYVRSRLNLSREERRIKQQEEINEAKLQFFTNISHEIRTPMTMVINPLEKLISENDEPLLQKTYLMIYRNAQRILRLVNQLMDVRKLDKGQMKLNFMETDIVGFIKDLMQTFEYLAKKKNIDFNFLHADETLNVWIDLNNFDKALLNIMSNAFKYTPDNGNITVELKTGSNESVRGPLRRYFEISITDSGIGIDKDKIEQIFERFYQINNQLTNSNYGTGIGLHLTRSLVTLHHGEIFAENREDSQGTRFIVRLPLGCDHLKIQELNNTEGYSASDSAKINLFSDERTDSEQNLKNNRRRSKNICKVLIVEDEAEIRDYLKTELLSDYEILEASDGKQGLEVTLKEYPDLIISDIMMPQMDGITLTKKIKNNINISHIPVILLTAKTTPESRIEGLETGADAYISKPFNTEELKSTISNLIEGRERLKTKFSGKEQPDVLMGKIEINSADEQLMQKIMKVINENISNPELNVELLADKVGISRVHLHRRMKELTNQSAHNFLKGIRLKQASTLLRDKKLTVSEVAYATGFTNMSHFSSLFKEFYGMTPKEFISRKE